MRLSVGMKVGLVSLFSCLALLLGLLSSTGLAPAHTANSLQRIHISATALADDPRRGNFEHEGVFDPTNDSAANGCPAGMTSTTNFDKGEAPKSGCADPSSDPPPTGIYYRHDDHGHRR